MMNIFSLTLVVLMPRERNASLSIQRGIYAQPLSLVNTSSFPVREEILVEDISITWRKGYKDAMKKSTGVKPFDRILIVSLLIGAFCLWVCDFTGAEDPSTARIYSDKGLFREVPLHEATRIAVPGSLGESIVEVRSGEVSITHSPCANKLCIHTGKISRCGECILCLPNRVSVVISSRNPDMDALSY